MIHSAHVIGMGRLGRHLANRLEALDISVTRWSRTAGPGTASMEGWHSAADADAAFLAVPDGAIAEVAAQAAKQLSPETLMVHHAGAVPLSVLPVKEDWRAVMWPPMTFGTDNIPDWNTLPMGVESTHPRWREWAKKIAPNAFELTAENRPKLHLGAVLSGNLTAAWIGAVEALLKAHDLPISVLSPLIEESVNKALNGNALKSVSGPATRNDRATLEQQVTALHNAGGEHPELGQLHRILTNLILQHHGHPPLPPIQTTPGPH